LEGLWIYIENEPIIQKKNAAYNWNDLDKLLDNKNKQFIYKLFEFQQNKTIKNRQQYFPLLIGYNISDIKTNSIHWEIAIIDFNNFFIKKEFDRKARAENYAFQEKPILWQKTINCSYDRFFGRGKYSNEITKKKILIIGIGAIGSSLAKILVKGGVTDLTITDIDFVEQGNLCRAEYNLLDVGSSKIVALRMQMISSSPFVNIYFEHISKYPINSEIYFKEKSKLQKFDLIFDCSTDNEMALMLDNMELDNKVINLSITNKANELICLSGSNIMELKSHIVKQLDSTPALFYEGIGCHYPTFEASYLDINSHLFFAVKQIIKTIENGINFENFILKIKNDVSLTKYKLKRYFQKDLKLTIVVNEEIEEKIINTSIKFYPKESGGILVGSFFNDNKTIYISDTYIPKKTENSKTSFKRFVKDTNEYLSKKHLESKGEINYIGEWHSHPDNSSQFSSIDFNSMQNIAKEVNVKTKNPILIINGFTTKNNKLTFYVYKNNKLYEYEEI